MKTVTFYSYKGGVGRTLALANFAKYAVNRGFKVVLLDFDLEAPGLHYKFALRPGVDQPLKINKGIVDYISHFLTHGALPEKFEDFVIPLDADGKLHLIPAGDVTSSRYWKLLSNIEWRPLLYDENAPGIPLLLDLKARIEEELKPDLLLVDSRTGFTELGAISTVLFADTVVSLFVHNRENLEGTRSMLRSIQKSVRPPGSEGPVEIVGVLSRVPAVGGAKLIEGILRFMNEPAPSLVDTLSLQELRVLPSEPALELREELRIGGPLSVTKSALHAAYIHLCRKLLPESVGFGSFAPEGPNKSSESSKIEEMLSVGEALSELFPNEIQHRKDLRGVYRKLAAAADGDQSLAWRTKARIVSGHIANANPASILDLAEYLHDLISLPDIPAANRCFEANSLMIYRAVEDGSVAASDIYKVALLCQRIGDLELETSRESEGALEQVRLDELRASQWFEKQLYICKNLARISEKDLDYQAALAQAHSRLGEVLARTNPEAARANFAESIEISTRLAIDEPENSEVLVTGASYYDMLADLDRQDGVPDKARDSYQRGLALREQLSLDGNTENRRRIREIVKSYQKMSSLYAVDDPAQAQSWIIKCISLLEPFVSDPQASEELELLNRCRTFLAIMHLSSQPSDATITK